MKNVFLKKGLFVALAVFLPITAHGSSVGQAKNTAAGTPKNVSAQRVEVTVNTDGFVPYPTRVKAGRPVALVVTRKVERTCATDLVIKEFGISKPLPLNTPVEVTFTPKKAGKVRMACSMDMIAAELTVE